MTITSFDNLQFAYLLNKIYVDTCAKYPWQSKKENHLHAGKCMTLKCIDTILDKHFPSLCFQASLESSLTASLTKSKAKVSTKLTGSCKCEVKNFLTRTIKLQYTATLSNYN